MEPENPPFATAAPCTWQRPWLFCLACLITLIADLATKWWIFSAIDPALAVDAHHPAWLWLLQEEWQSIGWIVPQINPGAAWSMGSDSPWLIVALTVVLVPALIAYYWWQIRTSPQLLEHLGFALIIGGALGNAWDRLVSAAPWFVGYGGVRDFIHCDLNLIGIPYVWPTFNLADSGITIGLAIVVYASFRCSKKPCAS